MSLSVDWMDPGHELPPEGTYRDLDAWVNSKGEVFVGNRAIQVLPIADANRRIRAAYDVGREDAA